MTKRNASLAIAAIVIAAMTCIALLALGAGCASEREEPSEGQQDSFEASDIASSSTEAPDSPPSDETAEPESESPTSAAALQQASADIQAIAQASGMETGIAVIDLTSGGVAGYQADEPMVSASMIKLAIAYAFLERVQAGDYSLDALYALQPSDIVGGTGTLAGLGAGATVSYGELLSKMINVSDNTAANVLIDAAGGMDAVNAAMQSLGLSATRLNRYMMDSDAMAAGIENYTSADDMAKLLQMAYEGTFVDAELSALVMQALEEQSDYGGVLAGLPAGVSFAHKTGTLSTARHDGGIVEGEHPYVLVVLCGGAGFYEQGALDTMAQVASTTYTDIVA